MNLILLGGNSIINKQWLYDLATALKTHFPSPYIHHYHHWETGEKLVDLDYELNILSRIIQSQDPYTVIAKSAGVLLTLKGMAGKVLIPQKCIFVGTPVYWAKANDFPINAWLKSYSLPTLFIQQSYDPTLSFVGLKQYLENVNAQNYQLVEVPGKDHTYGDFGQLKKRALDFIV